MRKVLCLWTAAALLLAAFALRMLADLDEMAGAAHA